MPLFPFACGHCHPNSLLSLANTILSPCFLLLTSTTTTLAAAKRKAEVVKLRAEYEAIIRVKDAKANKLKECLSKSQDKLSEEKD
jgi:hypothetical protein